MDNRSEVSAFLTSRRARLSPAAAGVPSDGTARRVPGLRRREVAELAGMSIEYYTRLERGAIAGVSDSVLAAVARALQLDPAEQDHLYDLARAAGRRPAQSPRPRHTVSPELHALLDSITGGPAFVRNDRLDILAANLLGRAVYSDLFEDPRTPPNLARYAFLDPRARQFYPDWDKAADDTVRILRTSSGRDPYDARLTALVGELSVHSEDFARRWAAYQVKRHVAGRKLFHHPQVGDLHLTYQVLELPSDPGYSLLVYTPIPGTGTAEALAMLASWAVTDTHERPAADSAAGTVPATSITEQS